MIFTRILLFHFWILPSWELQRAPGRFDVFCFGAAMSEAAQMSKKNKETRVDDGFIHLHDICASMSMLPSGKLT